MPSNTIASTLDQLRRDFDYQASSIAKRNPKLPKKFRTKEEILRQKEALYNKYLSEINELLAVYHAVVKEKDADSVGALYARHSSQFQDSIIDQVRVILDDAVRKKIYIPRENVCFDIAIRGCKERRPGLIKFKKLVADHLVQTVMAFATSRLYRRTYRTLQFVEEELVERGIRGIFVKSNIDTAGGDHWRTLLQSLAANDEAQVRHSVAHIQASQEGLFVKRMVHTSLSLGYTGEVVEGEFTRRQRPRRMIVIDPETARWIVRMFYWYVVEGMSIPEIARRLNADLDAPAPTKSTTGLWTRTSVIRHLSNAEYRGFWQYGAKETKWQSKKDYAVQVPRKIALKEALFEELRVVPDDCWYAAQTLLGAEHGESGRKPNDRDRTGRTNLLRQLFVCPTHQRKLVVGGAKGCVLLCPTCQFIEVAERPLFTHLNRELALRLTFERLIDCLDPTDELVNSILDVCARESASLSQSNPESLDSLRAQLDVVTSTIDFNRRNPGVSVDEQRRTEKVLKDLRYDQNALLARLRSVETAMTVTDRIPTREVVIKFLDSTSDQLRLCLVTRDETSLRNGRRIIDELIDGKVELHQIGERVKSRGHLQGRFQIDAVTFAVERLTGMRLVASKTARNTEIDFKRPKLIDEQSETAKRLWDEGLLHVEIARQMGSTPSCVTKFIQHWHDKRGLDRPNNKSRRKQLENKQEKLPFYKLIANDVVEHMKSGHSNLEISRRLNTNDCNVGKAIKWWHQTRDLPVPTSVDRRQQKLNRAKLMLDDGVLIKDIAKELEYSPRGLKLALEKDARENGTVIADGRTRRGNANAGTTANGIDRADSNDG